MCVHIKTEMGIHSYIPLVLRPTVVWLSSVSVGEAATSVSSDSALGTPPPCTLSLLRLCSTEKFTAANPTKTIYHPHIMSVCVCVCVHVCMCVCLHASVHVCMYSVYMYNVHTCCWVYFLQHGTKLFQVTQTGAIFHHLAFTPRNRHHFMVIAHKVMNDTRCTNYCDGQICLWGCL